MENEKNIQLHTEVLIKKIFYIRGFKVMLDKDLASLYGVENRALKQAVRRNIDRFPEDFMFELTKEELENWRSHFATSNREVMGVRILPFAFTEHGVAMLSSVLKSKKAIEVNIAIMRTFVSLRKFNTDFNDLREAILQIEEEMNTQFKDIHQAINYLLEKEETKISQEERRRIGFKSDEKME